MYLEKGEEYYGTASYLLIHTRDDADEDARSTSTSKYLSPRKYRSDAWSVHGQHNVRCIKRGTGGMCLQVPNRAPLLPQGLTPRNNMLCLRLAMN